ncbi:trypsin-like serine protease [Nocardioides sp. LHG3406-4]|uniref:trypsin-like serine protease n=1 Tax=Nocardioides sp. LHG3406-4 TaxID=2804575 RepID=UPI003CEB8CE6
MLPNLARWVTAPIALALAMIGMMATPSGAITGNFVPDFEHEYVGLIVFYDQDGEFVQRCTGSLISPTVFLTAGHCVTIDDATGELASSARIYFEQDAGADYDPETDTPASSGYPYTGGVTARTFYAFDYQGITVPATTNDVGLAILDAPLALDSYGSLAAPGTLEEYGTGPRARVTVSGYGVTYVNGNPAATESYRSRLMANTWIIGTRGVANGINVQLSSAPGRGGGGTCFGDSGGPTLLYGTDTIVAVTSFGMSRNVCGGTEFNFRVDTAAVQQWMQSVLTEEQWNEINVVQL